MKVEKNTNKENTHKESVNLKIKDRTYLDTIEVRKIITLDLGFLSQMIYNHLIEKYIYFFNKNKLNSKEEFFQSYDDIAMGVRGNLSYHLINKGLDELIERGFITRNLKLPEGAKNNIPKHHYLLNMKILNDIVITPEEYKMPNKKKYEIQQDIKYAHSINVKKKDTPKVEITDNIVDTITIEDNKTFRESNTVETTDNKMNDNSIATTYKPNDNSNDDDSNELIGIGFDDDNNDTTIEEFKPIEERDDDEMIDNDVKEVIRPVKEPIKEFKPIVERDDDELIGIGFKELKTTVKPIILKRPEKGENVRRAIRKELTKQKEQEKKNIETIKEPIDNDNKAIEELNDKQPTEPTEPIDKEIEELNEHTPINPTVEPIKELKTAEELNRAKAKSIISNLSDPKINGYIKNMKLTNYDIMFLLSDGYTDGSNKDLDDKKRILNLIANNLI